MSQRKSGHLTPARVFKQALRAWCDDNALRLGASLSFYTLFAIAPVLLVAISIAGLVLGPDAVRGELVIQMDGPVGRDGAQAQALLDGASQRQSGVFPMVIGSFSFVLAATGAFLELQAALNAIWRVAPNPGANLSAYIIDRLRSFGIVVGIGFLLMVSLVVSAGLAAANTWLDRRAPGWPVLWQGVNITASFLVTTALFALLFRFLPDVKLEWRHVGTGSVVTAALCTAGKYVIGLYLARSTTASAYGAAASVMLLLLWVYYSSQILLFGAEFTRINSLAAGERPKIEEFAKRDPNAAIKATESSAPDSVSRGPVGMLLHLASLCLGNGVDVEHYRPRPDPLPLDALRIDAAVPYVLFVHRITRQKGIIHLVNAIRHLHGNVQVVLCAASPDTPDIAI